MSLKVALALLGTTLGADVKEIQLFKGCEVNINKQVEKMTLHFDKHINEPATEAEWKSKFEYGFSVVMEFEENCKYVTKNDNLYVDCINFDAMLTHKAAFETKIKDIPDKY